jgi:hypothetical protein
MKLERTPDSVALQRSYFNVGKNYFSFILALGYFTY